MEDTKIRYIRKISLLVYSYFIDRSTDNEELWIINTKSVENKLKNKINRISVT